MSRILGVLSVLVLVFGLALNAAAEEEDYKNAANNATQCGKFTNSTYDAVAETCTIVLEEGSDPATYQSIRYNVKNSKGWTVTVEVQTGGVVVSGTGANTVVVPFGGGTVVRCYNPVDKEFTNLDHPNCQYDPSAPL